MYHNFKINNYTKRNHDKKENNESRNVFRQCSFCGVPLPEIYIYIYIYIYTYIYIYVYASLKDAEPALS